MSRLYTTAIYDRDGNVQLAGTAHGMDATFAANPVWHARGWYVAPYAATTRTDDYREAKAAAILDN